MRVPRKPRKPTSLGRGSTRASSGGEVREPQRVETEQDHVPTAAMDDDDFAELDWDDELDDELDEEAEEEIVSHKIENGVYVGDDADQDWEESEPVDEPDAPARLSDRRREKLAEKRRVLLKRIAIMAAFVVFIGVAVWILFFSTFFRYQFAEADVTGAGQDTIIDVTEVASVARQHNGEPVLLVDTGALEREIVAAVPEVASASVTKAPPTSLNIDLTPHQPIACVGEGDCVAVADDGTELRVPAEELAGLPRVLHIPEELEPREALGDVLGVLDALSEDVRTLVGTVDIAANGIISLTLTDGRRINWGVSDPEDGFKAELIESLLAQDAWYYDVSVPRSPVTSN